MPKQKPRQSEGAGLTFAAANGACRRSQRAEGISDRPTDSTPSRIIGCTAQGRLAPVSRPRRTGSQAGRSGEGENVCGRLAG